MERHRNFTCPLPSSRFLRSGIKSFLKKFCQSIHDLGVLLISPGGVIHPSPSPFLSARGPRFLDSNTIRIMIDTRDGNVINDERRSVCPAFVRRERKKNRGEEKDESSISRAAALGANRSAFDS